MIFSSLVRLSFPRGILLRDTREGPFPFSLLRNYLFFFRSPLSNMLLEKLCRKALDEGAPEKKRALMMQKSNISFLYYFFFPVLRPSLERVAGKLKLLH